MFLDFCPNYTTWFSLLTWKRFSVWSFHQGEQAAMARVFFPRKRICVTIFFWVPEPFKNRGTALYLLVHPGVNVFNLVVLIRPLDSLFWPVTCKIFMFDRCTNNIENRMKALKTKSLGEIASLLKWTCFVFGGLKTNHNWPKINVSLIKQRRWFFFMPMKKIVEYSFGWFSGTITQ